MSIEMPPIQQILQVISTVSWKRALATSVCIYLVFFWGRHPIFSSESSDPITVLRFVMVTSFFIALLDIFAGLWTAGRKFLNGKRSDHSLRIANLQREVEQVRKGLFKERGAKSYYKTKRSNNVNLSSRLYALYRDLDSLRIRVPAHSFDASSFPVEPHLAYLERIYPMVSVRGLRDLKREVKKLDLSIATDR